MNKTLSARATLAMFCAVGLSACATPASTADLVAPPMGAAASSAEPAATMAEPAAEEAPAFTDAQADRGRGTFRGSCTECHASGDFADADFRFKWSRRSAGNLYALIQTQMPETAPGILTPEETVDLVTYILRMNGFEPGSEELAPDRDVLDVISLASIRE